MGLNGYQLAIYSKAQGRPPRRPDSSYQPFVLPWGWGGTLSASTEDDLVEHTLSDLRDKQVLNVCFFLPFKNALGKDLWSLIKLSANIMKTLRVKAAFSR